MKQWAAGHFGIVFTLVLALVLGLTAALAFLTLPDRPTVPPGVDAGQGKTVRMVTIDGIRCATIVSQRTSGIDCDWGNK